MGLRDLAKLPKHILLFILIRDLRVTLKLREVRQTADVMIDVDLAYCSMRGKRGVMWLLRILNVGKIKNAKK